MFENDDTWGVGILVFELGDLVGDFLFAVAGWLDAGFDVTDGFYGYAVLVVAVDELVFEFANFVNKDSEFVGYVGDVVVAGFTPEGELLLGVGC